MSVAGHPACTSAFSCAQRLREGGFPPPSSPDLHLRQMSRQTGAAQAPEPPAPTPGEVPASRSVSCPLSRPGGRGSQRGLGRRLFRAGFLFQYFSTT